jgi:acetyl-CoA carboxylase biotin carboxylase subunit
MFKKILIANRGEVALRIIRACKEMGIRTVAIHSQADSDSLHVKYADEKVCVGPPPSSESYLNIPSIISAAEITDAHAIHPGYGFLSENAYFAEICASCNIKFIGPPPEAIRRLGDKAEARKFMKKVGIPIIPGSEGVVEGLDEAIEVTRQIGYPARLKAAAGGGGKGMRVVENQEELIKSFPMVQREAQSAFGEGSIYVEKSLINPRHIEFQFLADEDGNVIHLGERECSIQRRGQKLIEESPSPIITAEMRKRIGRLVVKGVKMAGYANAGTMELLFEDGRFYFIEVNSRLQVEHPVTEMVTGIDLVKEQILIASGERLKYTQDDITFHGHALECRINSEDYANDFLPTPGTIGLYHIPGGPGVRVDSHVRSGYVIPPHYDSMLAKLITHGADRGETISRMKRALDEYVIEGVTTTIGFHKLVMADDDFLQGNLNTGFIRKFSNDSK